MVGAPGVAQELPSEDRALEPEIEDVYSVGSFDGELWETFGSVSQVAFDDAGNLYVLDRENSRVVVVDPQGEFLHEFGQEGDGPGEWRTPGSMAVLGDGSVVLADAGHRAYQVYGPDGSYQRSVPFETTGGVIMMGSLWPTPDGTSLLTAQSGTMSISISAGGSMPRTEGRPITRVSLDDGATDEVYRAWAPEPVESDGQTVSMGSGGASFRMGAMSGPRIFEPSLLLGVLPDGGLVVVDSSAYAVKLVDASGRERGRIVRPSLRPIEVTSRVEDRERQRRIDEIESGEGPQMRMVVRGAGGQDMSPSQDQIRQMQIDRIEGQEFYPEIPVIERLGVSREGTIWLRRSGEAGPELGPIDLVRADGTYLGSLEAESITIPAAFGPDGRVAFITRDDFDVPSVTVRRLPAEIR
jgi:hypothetical protein